MKHRNLTTRLTARCLGVLLICASLVPAIARGNEAGQKIVDVTVQGNSRVSADRILSQMQLRVGSEFSRAAVDEDLKRIWALEEFDNVIIEPIAVPEGIQLKVTVVERPVLRKVEFVGNKHFSDAKLIGKTNLRPGKLTNEYQIVAATDTIAKAYREDGYFFVSVDLDKETLRQERLARFTIVEGPRLRIQAVNFEGNASIGRGELIKQMRTRPYKFILNRGIYDPETLEEDLIHVANYYRNQGFMDVNVSRKLAFNEAKTRLTITIIIEEGLRYHLRSVAFEGVERFSRAYLQKQLSLQPKRPYTADGLQRDIQALLETYGEVGLIDATVDPQIDYTAEPALLDLTFKITEGKPVRIGAIRIVGNQVTQDKVIRRELEFFPEQEFNVKAIRRSEQRLMETGLFAQPAGVRIRTVPTADPLVRDIVVEVEETETGRIFFGAGVSSDLGVVGTLGYTEQNFDISAPPKSAKEFWRGEGFKGAGQTFRIVLEPGTEYSRFRIDFVEPYLFDRNISLSLSGYYTTWDRNIYDEKRAGVSVGLGKRLKKHWRASVDLRLENVNIDNIDSSAPSDVTDVRGSNPLIGIGGTIARDTTDSRLSPTTGSYVGASAEVVGGNQTFTRLVLDGRRYWTVDEDVVKGKSVLAVRGRVGAIGGNAPIFERFYAGGHGSMRGFAYRGAGPHKAGEPVGGSFLLLGGTEYSFPIVKRIKGVLFVDAGTVTGDGGAGDFRASAGFAVRFELPIYRQYDVPFDLAFAVPIAKGPDDEEQIFSFTIGRPF